MSDYEETDEQVDESTDPVEGEQEISEEGQQAAPEATDDDVIQISRSDWNATAARARVAERDRRIQDERMNILISSLQQAAAQNQEPAEQEEEIDPNDTAAVLKRQQDSILKKMAEQEQREAQRQQQTAVSGALSAANEQIQSYASTNPELFMAAMDHLAGVFKDSLELQYPNLTQPELLKMAVQAVNKEKLQMVSRGENVGEAMYRKALVYRFDQNRFLSQKSNGQQRSVEDPKETIKREKKKANSGTIAGIPSSPGKAGFNARDARKMTVEQYSKTIDDLIEAGVVRTRTKYGRGKAMPMLEDLLEGKGQ